MFGLYAESFAAYVFVSQCQKAIYNQYLSSSELDDVEDDGVQIGDAIEGTWIGARLWGSSCGGRHCCNNDLNYARACTIWKKRTWCGLDWYVCQLWMVRLPYSYFAASAVQNLKWIKGRDIRLTNRPLAVTRQKSLWSSSVPLRTKVSCFSSR